MQNKAYIILHFSILLIVIYYYNKVEKVWLKRAVIAFGICALCAILKDFLPWKQALSLILWFSLPIAYVFTWVEVFRSKTIKYNDKVWINIFLLPVIISAILLFFHPFIFLNLPFSLLSIGILIYYTFKYQNSDYLTQELAVMNLLGIEFVLRLVKGFFTLYS